MGTPSRVSQDEQNGKRARLAKTSGFSITTKRDEQFSAFALSPIHPRRQCQPLKSLRAPARSRSSFRAFFNAGQASSSYPDSSFSQPFNNSKRAAAWGVGACIFSSKAMVGATSFVKRLLFARRFFGLRLVFAGDRRWIISPGSFSLHYTIGVDSFQRCFVHPFITFAAACSCGNGISFNNRSIM